MCIRDSLNTVATAHLADEASSLLVEVLILVHPGVDDTSTDELILDTVRDRHDRLEPVSYTHLQHLGSISDAERLRSLYTESSVLISTSERESFGQTLLEALACGTPVIARDSGGPADIVIEGAVSYTHL